MGKNKYERKENVEGVYYSFFDQCSVCYIRRINSISCRGCKYYERCVKNKRDIIEKLNSTLKECPKRNPAEGLVK